MKKLLLIFGLLGLMIAGACADKAAPPVSISKSTPPPAPARPVDTGHEDDGHDAPRISLIDAKKEFDSGTAVFVDTHAPDQFKAQHIPGALNIPANDIGTKADKLPKGKKIIAYCS